MRRELTHWAKEKSPALYRELSRKAFKALREETGLSELELVSREQKRLKNKFGREFSVDEARDEIIARACEDMLSLSARGKELFSSISNNEQKSFAEKARQLLKTISEWLNKMLASYSTQKAGIHAEAQLLRGTQENVQSMLETWEKMIDSAREANKALTAEGTTGEAIANEAVTDSNAQYSFRDSINGFANDFLLSYNEELTGFIKQRGDYIVDSFEKLKDIVTLAFENPQKKATAYFGIIPAEILRKIEKSVPNLPKELNGTLFKTGKDYSVAVTLDSIRHLVDEKSLTREDIIDYLDRMADTIVEFDTVHFDYYYQYGQKHNGLLFKKTFDDSTLISFEIVSNKKRTLNLQTFYMQKGDYKKKKAAETLLMDKPSADAQGGGRSTFNNSILNSPEKNNSEIVNNEGVQFSEKDYSYEALTSKPDMQLTVVGDNVSSNRADIVHQAIKNAKSVGYTNENGNAVVRVDDIKTDVIVPKKSIVHGLDRRMSSQAPVMVKIGEVLKNAIRINELVPRSENAKNTYVLIGSAVNKSNELYIASFVVNRFTNEVTEIDVLYSANAKKESAALLPKITDKSATPTDSVISIAELLEYVNRYFPDILPESVLRHYGHTERPDGTLGESVLFSEKDTGTSAYDVLGESGALEKRLKALEADVIRLREMLHIEKHLTHGKVLDRKSVDAAARFLVKYGDSTYSSKELSEQLYDLYTDMRNTLLENPDVSYDELYARVYEGRAEILL